MVFTHVHENFGFGGGDIASDDIIKTVCFYGIDRLFVPMFFMMSGYLIISRQIKLGFHYMWKRVAIFIVLFSLYSIINGITQRIILHDTSIVAAIMLALTNDNVIFSCSWIGPQLWFMPAIINLYLIAPFIAEMVKRLSSNNILVLLVISVFMSILPDNLTFSEHSKSILNLFTRDGVGAYLNYFIIGYMICSNKFNFSIMQKNIVLMIVTLLGIAIPIAIEIYYHQFIGQFHWYSSSIFIMVSSICLFCILRNTSNNKLIGRFNILITSTAVNSFGIYLIHYAVLLYVHHFMIGLDINLSRTCMMMVLFITTMCVSYLISNLLYSNKVTRWLVK